MISICCPPGLKDPVLIRLDVDSKLSDQLKMAFLSVRHEDKSGEEKVCLWVWFQTI